MNYEFTAIPDAEVPSAVEPVFQHVVNTYASEANKTVSMKRGIRLSPCPPSRKGSTRQKRPPDGFHQPSAPQFRQFYLVKAAF